MVQFSNQQLIAMWVIAAAGVAYALRRAGKFAAEHVDKINPVSPENVAYQGTNKVLHSMGVDERDTLGTWLHGVIHGE